MRTPRKGRFSLLMQILVLLSLLLGFLAWLQPLHLLPWISWHSEVLAFAAMLLLGGAGLRSRLRSTERAIALPAGVWMLLALLALVQVQALAGMIHFWGDALVLSLYLGLCATGWLLAYHATAAVPDPEKIPWPQLLAGTLLVAALLSAVIALAQAFDVWEDFPWINRMPSARRPGGNLGQPNQLGTLLVMGLASLIYLYEMGRLQAMAGLWLAGFLLLAIAATESRTAVLSVLLLAVWCLRGHRRSGLMTGLWPVMGGVLAFLLLYWTWPMLLTAGSVGGPPAEVNVKPGMRLTVWLQLMETLSLRPWAGWGMREVSTAHNAVLHSHESAEPYTYAHNLILDLALGIGIPLTVLVTGAAMLWIHRRISAATHRTAWFAIAAVLPVGIHSMLEFPFAYAYFLGPVMLLLGMLDGTTRAGTLGRIGRKTVGLGWLLLTTLAGWTVYEYVGVEEDFRVVRFEAMRVGQTPPSYERPPVLMLTQLGALLEATRIEPKAGMPSAQIDSLRTVALRFPWPATQSRYALALVLNGQQQEGTRQLKVLRAMHGEGIYRQIREQWLTLARDKYPELSRMDLP